MQVAIQADIWISGADCHPLLNEAKAWSNQSWQAEEVHEFFFLYHEHYQT